MRILGHVNRIDISFFENELHSQVNVLYITCSFILNGNIVDNLYYFVKSLNNEAFVNISIAGAPAGGGGTRGIPPETENIVEKWGCFPELYKMAKVLEDGIEK